MNPPLLHCFPVLPATRSSDCNATNHQCFILTLRLDGTGGFNGRFTVKQTFKQWLCLNFNQRGAAKPGPWRVFVAPLSSPNVSKQLNKRGFTTDNSGTGRSRPARKKEKKNLSV